MKLTDWLKKKVNIEKVQKLKFSKKTIINLIALLCIGITFIIISDFYNSLFKKDNNEAPVKNESTIEQDSNGAGDTDTSYVESMEKELEAVLCKIQNAGKVSVMITLESGKVLIPAKDETISDKVTNEKDTEGGTRIINESNTSDQVVFENVQGGDTKPLIVQEINPKIKGVIVVAEGAKDPKVKLKLTKAVETVLDVPAYRVMVYEGDN